MLLGSMALATLIAVGLAFLDLGIPAADFELTDAMVWMRSRALVLAALQWTVFIPTAVFVGPRLGYTPADLGLTRRPSDVRTAATGVVFGAAMLLTPALLGRVTGGFTQDQAFFSVAGWLTALALLALLAFGEEVLFRGILMHLARHRLGDRGALALTTLLFAALHGGNPGASPAGAFGVLLAGLLLGLAALRTGGLVLPTAIHLGWNAAAGLGVGLPVSGLGLPSLSRFVVTPGTERLYGGAFGPEEGLVFHVALMVGIVTVARWGTERPRAA